MELAYKVKERLPTVGINMVWKVIKSQGLKRDKRYAAYNFRNKAQEQSYEKTGVVPSVTPSIYNDAAVDFIVDVLESHDA